MPRTTNPTNHFETVAEVLERMPEIPPRRIRLDPKPGTATGEDVIAALQAADKRLYELVDGVLVEKVLASKESCLALWIGHRLCAYLEKNNVGIPFGADGPFRLRQGLVRLPDVSFISYEQLPEGLPDEAIISAYPDLAVEVLSENNTRGEVRRKLREYFLAGTRLVWVINPKTQTAEVYTAPGRKKRIGKTGTLDGGEVLPGFTLSLADLFARAGQKPKNV
jgi:Uma2 family endonuclease